MSEHNFGSDLEESDDIPKSFLSKKLGMKFLMTIMSRYGAAVEQEFANDDNELTRAVKVDNSEYISMVEEAF